jgi:hypothetical protein
MPGSTLKVPAEIPNLIRQLHPQLKRKGCADNEVRAVLTLFLFVFLCGRGNAHRLIFR